MKKKLVMRFALSMLLVASTFGAAVGWAFSAEAKYFGSRFSEVWDQVSSDPYRSLPHLKVGRSTMVSWARNFIREAANRTLVNKNDILPRFDKLVHPNGICFAGTWHITEQTPYTGYFSKGSKGLIIARVSSANSFTEQGQYRAFGLAGKVYPTDNRDHADHLKPATFFTIEDLGGTLTPHFTDAELTNAPPTSLRFSLAKEVPTLLTVKNAFEAADKATSNTKQLHIGIRQLYEIAQLGMKDPSLAKSPALMKLKAAPGQTVNATDFREELRLAHHDGKLIFDINVKSASKDAAYHKIGTIEFTEDAVSDSCDHRLHFAHPAWNSNFD